MINNIKNKKYEDAFMEFEKSFNFLKNELELETYENPNEELFRFILYVGENSKKSDIVYFCSMILATSLNYFENAYKYAYELAKKIIKIKPSDLENWEWLLFLLTYQMK